MNIHSNEKDFFSSSAILKGGIHFCSPLWKKTPGVYLDITRKAAWNWDHDDERSQNTTKIETGKSNKKIINDALAEILQIFFLS